MRVTRQPGRLLALLNLAIGLSLLLGSPTRTSSPSYSVAKALMPIDAWGLLFITGAVVCWTACGLGRRGAVLVAFGAGIHGFWALQLLRAAMWDQRAALTGIVVYTWLAVLHVHVGQQIAKLVG